MNRLIHFRHTPSGRTKMIEISADAAVSPGATSNSGSTQWEYISIRVADKAGKTDDSYSIQMDRETAERIARHITGYLKERL